LKALGIPLLEGRAFAQTDIDRRAAVALVNEAFVRTRMQDGRPAIGRVVRIPRLSQAPFKSPKDTFDVIGVVKNAMNRGFNDALPEVYVPYTLAGAADRLVVLARDEPAGIMKATLGQIYAIDPEQPATDVRPMDDLLDEFEHAGPRFNLVLFSVFAALGLALSVVGVYGVMSSSVAQQVHEVGVRMAIGASPGSVFKMVVARGARLLGAGIALGLLGTLFSARLLAAYVWQASTFDWLTFAAVSVVLLVAGLQACVWPARRAARVSPIVALRQE
jgi:putative ABC transport system permease protein